MRSILAITKAPVQSHNISTMLYPVGTHIDLRYLNDKPIQKAEPKREYKPRLYAVGTRIVFVFMESSQSLLQVRAPA